MKRKYTEIEIKEMYDRNVDMLYKISYTYFKGNITMVEDSIQDVFLKVIDKKIRFESLEHEKAWFIVAIKNNCKNVLKHKWYNDVSLDFDVSNIDNVDKDDSLIDLVMNLPEKYKLPIYLFYYEEYSCVEISKILNVPENTIYSYLNRGRKILKEKVGGDIDEE